MISKLEKRLRRSRKTRSRIKTLEAYRLSVHRSSKHIYAQITSPQDNTVVAAATVEMPTNSKTVTVELTANS